MKKMFSLMIASAIMIFSVSTMASNAGWLCSYKDTPEYIARIGSKVMIDEKYAPLFDWAAVSVISGKSDYYISEDMDELLVATLESDNFSFKINANNANFAVLKKEISEKIKNDLNADVKFYDYNKTCLLYNIDGYSAKAISAYLKEDDRFYDFEYDADKVWFSTTYFNSPLTYNMEDDEFAEYVEKNYSNAEVVIISEDEKASDMVMGHPYIKLADDASITDYLDIAWEIYNDLKITPCGFTLCSFDAEKYIDIDVDNYVDGDANCDGEYTIADSTAILQHLGNEDKYGLSLQGEFNADIYNVGDGVTPMDALEVQKAMASKG